jgi:hypothetical protein
MPVLVQWFESKEKEVRRDWFKAKMVIFRRYLRL